MLSNFILVLYLGIVQEHVSTGTKVENLYVKNHETAVLRCSSKKIGHVNMLAWRRDGAETLLVSPGKTKHLDSRISANSLSNSTTLQSRLIIKDMGASDEGKYFCIHNNWDNVVQTVHLHMGLPPIPEPASPAYDVYNSCMQTCVWLGLAYTSENDQN